MKVILILMIMQGGITQIEMPDLTICEREAKSFREQAYSGIRAACITTFDAREKTEFSQ